MDWKFGSKRMIVGFDWDGCVDNFGEGVRRTLEARSLGHLWKSGPTPDPYWNFYEDWSHDDGSRWTFLEFKELVDWGVDNEIIFTGHWREGGLETVRRVKDMGHEIVVITDRAFGSDPLNSQRNTLKALADAHLEVDEIIFSADKTCRPVDIMVEDKLDNYDKLVANDTLTFLINRPWNRVPEGDTRLRIDDITDYGDIIETLTYGCD